MFLFHLPENVTDKEYYYSWYNNERNMSSYWPLPLKCQCHVSIQPIKANNFQLETSLKLPQQTDLMSLKCQNYVYS